MQGNQVSESVIEAAADVRALQLWSPVGIVLWSLLLTPAFGAWLQMYNYRRLGDYRRAEASRRWALAGLAVLAWNALASAVGQRVGMDCPLFDWMNAGMLLAWLAATATAHARAVGHGYARSAWDGVVALGLLAALGYLAASGVLQLLLVALT